MAIEKWTLIDVSFFSKTATIDDAKADIMPMNMPMYILTLAWSLFKQAAAEDVRLTLVEFMSKSVQFLSAILAASAFSGNNKPTKNDGCDINKTPK
jgi:hypothetical protein